jgi:hypothetical protein|tara:strand:+ start:357 stop:758 length:402 start_codon:yes stop_codon:yes gene_type:complete
MASQLKVDTLTGVTTAGSIVVTGEGNSTTTNLQQGLNKAWLSVNQDGTMAILDSFNIGSISDDGTGKTDATYTSNMSSANYSNSVTAGNSNNKRGHFFSPSTSQQQIEVHQVSANSTDTDSTYVCSFVAGDLA